MWETGTYDPATDTMYWGTGNPGPDYDAEYRPGDNLWTDSVLAMDPNTGKVKWAFQYTPNDPFDYDEISEHPLVDATINGQPRKLVIHAGRNGYFYEFDRITTGQFVNGKQYADNNNWTWTRSGDRQAANYDPRRTCSVFGNCRTHSRQAGRSGLHSACRRQELNRVLIILICTFSMSNRSRAATGSPRRDSPTSSLMAAQ